VPSIGEWPLVGSTLAAATERAVTAGSDVALVGTTYLPDRGVLLCLFEAGDVAAIDDVLAAANLPALRVDAAVDVGSPLTRGEPRT
jgi:hypothetical protein